MRVGPLRGKKEEDRILSREYTSIVREEAARKKAAGSYSSLADNKSEEPKEHPVQEHYFPLRVVIYLAAYLVVGSVVYRHIEGINYLEGLYLSVITFTTVGYGDLTPKDDRGRVFTCFFIALALMGVAQLVDIVFDYLVQQRKLMEKQAIFASWFHQDEEDEDNDCNDDDTSTDWVVPSVFDSDTDNDDNETAVEAARHSQQTRELVSSFIFSAVYMLGVIFVGVIFYSFIVDDFNCIESFYLSTVTVTTVGYGDIVPTNDMSRLFTGFYAVFGTIAFARSVGYFIETLGAQRDLIKHEKLLSASALDYDTWELANADGTSRVTKVEFVYMRLLQMGLIDEHVRMKIENQFDRMDKDHSGDLTMVDIVRAQAEVVKSSKKRSMRGSKR